MENRLMTEMENLALREPDSPGSYHSSGQNGSPGDFLRPPFSPRTRGSSVTSQSSERGSRKEALGSPHPLVGDERFDTTHVQPAELDDSVFQDDEEPDERFSNPAKYFDDLDQLEEDLADHSSLNIYDEKETFKFFPDPSTLSSVTPKSDVELLHIFDNHKDEAYGRTGLHLLRCRNIIFAAYNNKISKI